MSRRLEFAQRGTEKAALLGRFLGREFGEDTVPFLIVFAFVAASAPAADIRLERRQRRVLDHLGPEHTGIYTKSTHRLPPRIEFPQTMPTTILSVHRPRNGVMEGAAVEQAETHHRSRVNAGPVGSSSRTL